MKSFVIDACVAIKWYIPEIHSENALRLLEKNYQFYAPDLIYAEVGNILWKKACLKKELHVTDAKDILTSFKRLPFKIYANEYLVTAAWNLAQRYQCAVYDCLYLALAQLEDSILVTADKVFFDKLKLSPEKKFISWIDGF